MYDAKMLMSQIIRSRSTPEQMQQMLEALGIYIKLAVDIQRKILAGGGELHADCEKLLLEGGSEQRHIWGANWLPLNQTTEYESIINIRPSVGNRSMEIQDSSICQQIDQVTQKLLGNVQWQ
jgi:Protein of unknown function (DUF5674)